MKPIAIKLGGSLYDLPDLRQRLHHLVERLSPHPLLFIPGGGVTADAIRTLDRCHRLGQESAHWLALQTLTVNAHFLHALLPGFRIVADVPTPEPHAIIDALAFAQGDESDPGRFPHTWDVTSDSLAVRIAYKAQAARLFVLKSTACPADVHEAARQGVVDPFFPEAIRQCPGLEVCLENFRSS